MKKATIVEDAVAHIEMLQQTVVHLKDQLWDEVASPEEGIELKKEEFCAAEGMNSLGIQVLSTIH